MSKKKKHWPEDIEELMEICYGTDYNRKKKYQDMVISDVISPKLEKKVIDYINPSLKIEKIELKKGMKTPDYIIKSESLFLEVTSINMSTQMQENITLYLKQLDIPRKLSEAISHIEEKDKLGYYDFYIGGMIFIDIRLCVFINIMEEETLKGYIKKSTFIASNIDFLFVVPRPASINREDSDKRYPPLLFVKTKEMRDIMSRVFPKIKVIILS